MTGVSPAHLGPWKEEVWQDYQAPIMRVGEQGERELLLASYGVVPKPKMPPGMRLSTMNAPTMNARAETVGEKRHIRSNDDWRRHA